jgi:hypothetical protein
VALKICLFAGALVVFSSGLSAQTQAAAKPAANGVPAANGASAAGAAPGLQQSPSLESAPRVPGVSSAFQGFNAGINYSAVHNTTIGWYSVVTPALSWAFSSHYSADVNTSVYFKRQYQTTTAGTPPKVTTVETAYDAGDTLFGLHASFSPRAVEDTVTATISAPTGDVTAGLGAGRVTFDFTNHLLASKGPAEYFLDLGAGDSSYLFDNSVERNSSSRGGLAHFMIGAQGWIADRVFLEQVLYEQLPFGSQTIYAEGRQPPPGQPPPPSGTAVSTGASEDNGFTSYFGVPVSGNVNLSGYYNRSLRQHSNTVSFGVTWVLRGSNRKWTALVDRALEEAERPRP